MNTATNKTGIDVNSHAGSAARYLRLAREGVTRSSLYIPFRPGPSFRQELLSLRLMMKRQAPQLVLQRQPHIET
jgi:hypothetical protein